MEISVVYPAYNEQDNIEATVGRSIKSVRKNFSRFEIIIINDGSTDRTAELAERLARENECVRVLHNEQNLGVGQSLIRGLRAARCELVVHNGMDLPFDLDDLPRLTAELHRADIVVAARLQHAGYTPWRRLASFVNHGLTHLLFPLKLKDYNFVQLYRRQVLEAVRVTSRSAAFVTPEILIRSHVMGYRIVEVDIEFHARRKGSSVVGRPTVVLACLADLLRFWWRYRTRGIERTGQTPSDPRS